MEDNYLKNFAMIIPQGSMKFPKKEVDPNGAPIYAGCKSEGPCACTGACKRIVGHSQDPEDIRKHIEAVEAYNQPLKAISYITKEWIDESGNKVRSWEIKQ